MSPTQRVEDIIQYSLLRPSLHMYIHMTLSLFGSSTVKVVDGFKQYNTGVVFGALDEPFGVTVLLLQSHTQSQTGISEHQFNAWCCIHIMKR